MQQNKACPLAGIQVVELGSSVAAPYAGWVLAALGADVVKVERPGSGDDARHWGKLAKDGSSSYFHAFNRNKRSVTLNLREDAEREWLQDYCAGKVDVVIQNMRPGRAEAQGLGPAALRARNPRIIYCNMGAFGASGPLKDHPGYDPLMQACGGLMSVTGEPGRPPIRVGTSVVDMGTGMWTVIGILAALQVRAQTGEGQVVDTSLYETSLAWMSHISASAQLAGCDPQPSGSSARGIAPYQAYFCSDGYLVVAAANNRLFGTLTGVLGHPEWASDERFASNQARVANLDALNALMEPVFARRSRGEWSAALEGAGIPHSQVRSVLEAISDPQAEALGIMRQLPGCEIRFAELPVSFDGMRPLSQRLAPELGQHNGELKGRP